MDTDNESILLSRLARSKPVESLWRYVARLESRTPNISFASTPNITVIDDGLRRAPDERPAFLSNASRYSIEQTFAEGGMGALFTAFDNDLRRRVILKTLKDYKSPTPERRSRFFREAHVTAQLDHPNIVPLLDLGSFDGAPFFSMPLVRAVPLNAYMDSKYGDHHLDHLPELVDIFLKICDAMEYAHSRGVVHQDLKPDNVLVGVHGVVRVVDWGLSKKLTNGHPNGEPAAVIIPSAESATIAHFQQTVTGAASVVQETAPESLSANLTLEGEITGTPGFMAPEQAISNIESIDERTDIYGLGAILYFILTKEHPNRGENAKDALCGLVLDVRESTKHASSSPIPKKLAAICDRALAKRKDERFQSVAELSAAVRAARVEHLKGATLKVVAALVLDCCVLPFLVSL